MTKQHAVTLSAFVAESNLPATLIRAVVRQIGGWEQFTESAPDIANHGIDGGFHGFIYYVDTEAFAKRHRKDIAKMASQQAEDMGTGVFKMIRGFGCFLGQDVTDEEIGTALYAGKDVEGGVSMLNALAWYAGEEVARAYVDLTERE